MRILFCVLGEGRGHLTQAMAAKEIVEAAGHEIVRVVVGVGPETKLPGYFVSAMPMPVMVFPTLAFIYDRSRSVNLPRTIFGALRCLPDHVRAAQELRALVRELKPDVIVNFFEPVTGMYALFVRDRPPVVAVGHQFLHEHPAFVRTRDQPLQRWCLKWFTRLVGSRSTRLALSHYEAPDVLRRRLTVAPPLLRRQLFDVTPDPRGKFLLVYLLNHGYSEQVIAWHTRHPRMTIHCFYDKPGAPVELAHDATLTFHRLDGEKYLRMMADCRAVVCTAGFESACEAAYLGKPLLMFPVENHVEQRMNALDAAQAGLGVWNAAFDLDCVSELPERVDNRVYRAWVERAGAVLLRALTGAVKQHRHVSTSTVFGRRPGSLPSRGLTATRDARSP